VQGITGPRGTQGAAGAAGADAVVAYNRVQQYANFNGGLQMRWGIAVNDADGADTISFTVPFSNGCQSITVTRTNGGSESILPVTGCSRANFTIDRNNSVDGNQVFRYIAIGY
jgi:hypothetical protein